MQPIVGTESNRNECILKTSSLGCVQTKSDALPKAGRIVWRMGWGVEEAGGLTENEWQADLL